MKRILNKESRAAIELMIANDLITKDVAEKYFPELKESEDEKMRAMAIKAVYAPEAQSCIKSWGINPDDVIAWLEKQGERKPLISDDALREGITHFGITQYQIDNWLKKYIDVEKQGEQKPADRIRPKFNIGDWVTDGSSKCQIRFIDDTQYWYSENCIFGNIEFVDKRYHLWTIQDAKDGDVLACNEEILLFKSYSVQGRISLYCWHNGQTNNFHSKEVTDTLLTTRNKICPATNKQRDLLFKKMREAGYEWDAEKKELKKIEQEPSQWNISDYRTWQYIVSDVLTKKDGIGQYLDDGECKKIAKYMQEEWSNRLGVEQRTIELPKGQDYGIDGLDAAIDILTRTLGKVDGYQTDDGILEHKCAISAVKQLAKLKPAEWSEEDETYIEHIINAVMVCYTDYKGKENPFREPLLDWLKILKYRVGCEANCTTTKEWSEEDKIMLDFAIRAVGLCKQYAINHQVSGYTKLPDVPKKYEELQTWLKNNFKDRYTWKPSDEQMKLLREVQQALLGKDCHNRFVNFMYELKRLREE